jgi:hypothetical protein
MTAWHRRDHHQRGDHILGAVRGFDSHGVQTALTPARIFLRSPPRSPRPFVEIDENSVETVERVQ